MTKKKVYISGKISGEDMIECNKKFQKAAFDIVKNGHIYFNPFNVYEIEMFNQYLEKNNRERLNDMFDRKSIMEICINGLLECDAIYLLKDWQQSEGATLEATIAKSLGMEIIYEQ